jgi:hypothetical protein
MRPSASKGIARKLKTAVLSANGHRILKQKKVQNLQINADVEKSGVANPPEEESFRREVSEAEVRFRSAAERHDIIVFYFSSSCCL